MAKLISIYWRDIPAQVIGRVGRTNFKRELEPRFAQAIDRAAMRARKITADAYLSDWRRESIEVEGDIEPIVLARVAELEAQFPHEYLERVIRAHGSVARLNALPATPDAESDVTGDDAPAMNPEPTA